MLKNSLKVIALLSVAAPAMAASNFDYVSGGYHYQNNKKLNEEFPKASNDTNLQKQIKKGLPKSGLHGGYLELSKDLYKGLFVSARGALANGYNNYAVGAGYHHPVSSNLDIYGLIGVSGTTLPILKKDTKIANQTGIPEKVGETYMTLKPAPTIELGLKANLNDKIGVTTSVGFSNHKMDAVKFAGNSFSVKNDGKVPRIEARLAGHYKLSDNLALETGYTYTNLRLKMGQSNKTISLHSANAGIRYFF